MDLVSGTPFWPVKNGLIASYPALEKSVDCDVAVLGAGITGALAAWQLAEAGASVVVLDKRDVATGSTCASTSLLQYEVDVPLRKLVKLVGEQHAVRAYHAGLDALKSIERLDGRLGGGHGFRRSESLQGASRESHVSGLREELALRRLHGFDVGWRSRAELARTTSLPFAAALVAHDAARIDVHRFTHSLLRSATALGARVHDRTRIARHTTTRNTITLHTDTGLKVRARHLVVATGYETAPYLADSLTKLVVTFALVTEPCDKVPGWPADKLIWETARPYTYLRRTEDGRVIIGGYDESTCSPRRRTELLPRKTAALSRRLRKLFPKAAFEVAYSWAGTFAETPDGLPYIGTRSGSPHMFFALGYGGNGITFSLIAAEVIRDLICEGASRDAELFRFDREAAN